MKECKVAANVISYCDLSGAEPPKQNLHFWFIIFFFIVPQNQTKYCVLCIFKKNNFIYNTLDVLL